MANFQRPSLQRKSYGEGSRKKNNMHFEAGISRLRQFARTSFATIQSLNAFATFNSDGTGGRSCYLGIAPAMKLCKPASVDRRRPKNC